MSAVLTIAREMGLRVATVEPETPGVRIWFIQGEDRVWKIQGENRIFNIGLD